MDLIEVLVERVRMLAGFTRSLPQLAIAFFVLLVAWGVAHLVRSAVGRVASRTREAEPQSCSRRLRAFWSGYSACSSRAP